MKKQGQKESIVFPILVELRNINDKFFTIHSGDVFTAAPELDLDGECDFILAKDVHTFNISVPIFQLVEAKKNGTELGVAQCAAQMIGTKIFNDKKGVHLPKIYGCVTTGKEWLFLCLENNTLYINKNAYPLQPVKNILGIFQQII